MSSDSKLAGLNPPAASTAVPLLPLPPHCLVAALVQRRLGLGDSGIPAFDINATCLSFLLAFDRVLAGFALKRNQGGFVSAAAKGLLYAVFAADLGNDLDGDGSALILLPP